MRQLVWMAEGRDRQQWLHTASSLCLLANINRDPKLKSTPFTLDDFNPHVTAKPKKTPKHDVTILKMFLPK